MLLLAAQSGLGQSSEVTELLQKVAATYRGIQDYQVQIRRVQTGSKHPIQTDHIADSDLHFDPSRSLAFNFDVPRPVMVMARLGQRFYFQSGDASWKVPSFWLTDGVTTWHYVHGLNKYTEEPARPWPDHPAESHGPPSIEWKYLGRFRVVDSMIDKAKLMKENVGASADCPEVTAIIDLQLSADANEELHIMTRSGLVCQAVVRSRRDAGPHVIYQTDTTTWSYRSVTGDVEQKSFVFVPPKHAKRVKSLR